MIQSRHQRLPFLWAGIIFLAIACSDGVEFENEVISPNFIESFLLDTFQTETYTYFYDSIPTSGFGQALVGRRLDDRLGLISASSYFRVAPAQYSDFPDKNARFVSLTLHLNYQYYQGDTSLNQSIRVYELAEDLEYPEDATDFYNTSTIASKAQPIGSLSFAPRPNKGEELEIPLSDSLGEQWFEALQNEGEEFSSAQKFTDFFKGIKLAPGSDSERAIFGFTCNVPFGSLDAGEAGQISEASLYLRLKYRQEEDQEEINYDLPIFQPEMQFNQIQWDRGGTVLEALQAGDIISSEETEGEAFLSGGLGLATRIAFPSLDFLTEVAGLTYFQYAELRIAPIPATYPVESPLPQTLDIFLSNDNNEILGQLSDFNGFPVLSTLELDEEFQENTAYTFDVTTYVQNIIDETEFSDNTLMLLLSGNDFFNTSNRLILGDGKGRDPEISLRVVVTRFD